MVVAYVLEFAVPLDSSRDITGAVTAGHYFEVSSITLGLLTGNENRDTNYKPQAKCLVSSGVMSLDLPCSIAVAYVPGLAVPPSLNVNLIIHDPVCPRRPQKKQ